MKANSIATELAVDFTILKRRLPKPPSQKENRALRAFALECPPAQGFSGAILNLPPPKDIMNC